ncbi:tetratricopeptide repeat protein [Caldisericum sp.]|uniref:tetratricopeptide repeat protein n=1 Tax=Caldisericum sp. TaxID=2499687 RepID=UPI003C8100DA
METLDARVFNAAGNLFCANNDYKNANLAYDLAVNFEEDPEVLYNRATTYYKLSTRVLEERDVYLKKAKEDLLKVVDKEPDNIKAHYKLAMVYSAIGEEKRAVEEYNYVYNNSDILGEEVAFISMGIYVEMEKEDKDIYSFFPDPTLIDIYNMLKDYPIEPEKLEELRKRFGDFQSSRLIAMRIKDLYERIFEKKEFDGYTGKSDRLKWEALLLFFVRDVNEDTLEFIKSFKKDGKMDTTLLPPYTRGIVERFREEILEVPPEKIKFSNLLSSDVENIKAIDTAIADFSSATIGTTEIVEIIKKLGLLKNKRVVSVIGTQEAERANEFMKKGYGEFQFVLTLLRKLRFALIKIFSKKLSALYDKEERYRIMKELLLSLNLSEDERYDLLMKL